MMENEFDRHAKSYDQVLKEAIPEGLAENEYFARYKVELMARELGGKKVENILDFGCGTGRSLGYIREAFPQARIMGFDVSPVSIEMAADRFPDIEMTADWHTISARRFDCVFAANVFHHIAKDERRGWLERCGDVLSDNGRIFWFEHNPLNPLTRLVFERCPFDADATMIGRGEALLLMKEARLVVLNSGYTLFFPQGLAFLRRFERLLRKVPMGAQYYLEISNSIELES